MRGLELQDTSGSAIGLEFVPPVEAAALQRKSNVRKVISHREYQNQHYKYDRQHIGAKWRPRSAGNKAHRQEESDHGHHRETIEQYTLSNPGARALTFLAWTRKRPWVEDYFNHERQQNRRRGDDDIPN